MGAIILKGNFIVGGQFSGGQFSSGAIFLGSNFLGGRGAMVWEAIFRRGNYPGGNFPRRQLSGHRWKFVIYFVLFCLKCLYK